MSEIIIPTVGQFEYRSVRQGIARLLSAAAPLASVHEEWKLEFDPASSLGKVTALLMGVGAHEDFVHSWMIGLENEQPITGEGGDDRYIGGSTSEYLLTFAVWGFFDYKGWRATFNDGAILATGAAENATAAAENEARRIKAFVRANPSLTLADNRATAQPFGVNNMDIHGFSAGNQIIVVQGSLRVRVRESFN